MCISSEHKHNAGVHDIRTYLHPTASYNPCNARENWTLNYIILRHTHSTRCQGLQHITCTPVNLSHLATGSCRGCVSALMSVMFQSLFDSLSLSLSMQTSGEKKEKEVSGMPNILHGSVSFPRYDPISFLAILSNDQDFEPFQPSFSCWKGYSRPVTTLDKINGNMFQSKKYFCPVNGEFSFSAIASNAAQREKRRRSIRIETHPPPPPPPPPPPQN